MKKRVSLFIVLILLYATYYSFSIIKKDNLTSVGRQDLESYVLNHDKHTVVLRCSEPTNYVYHMLSVAQVGYSNAYGQKYSIFHDKEDLDYLKSIEELLLTRGGESIGPLMTLTVSIPSSLESMDKVKLHYEILQKVIMGKTLDQEEYNYIFKTAEKLSIGENSLTVDNVIDLISTHPNQEEILCVSQIFIENIDIYSDEIYPNEKKVIETYIEAYLEKNSFDHVIEDLEKIIGLDYKYDSFIVELTSSTEFGPTAMNPSWYQNMHYIWEDYNFKEFITHEIAIYILAHNGVFDLNKYSDHSYNDVWMAFESLAEYYNEQYYGRKTTSYANGDSKVINLYRANPDLGPHELMQKALKDLY